MWACTVEVCDMGSFSSVPRRVENVPYRFLNLAKGMPLATEPCHHRATPCVELLGSLRRLALRQPLRGIREFLPPRSRTVSARQDPGRRLRLRWSPAATHRCEQGLKILTGLEGDEVRVFLHAV